MGIFYLSIWIVFMIHLGVLVLLKFFSASNLSHYLLSTNNLNISSMTANIIGNMVIFIPLGFLSPLLIVNLRKITFIFTVSVGVGLLLEMMQSIFRMGNFDIIDLVLNVVG